jgi:superfamily II DNA or RNA helicase
MKLTVENVWTHAEADPTEWEWLRGALSAEVSSFEQGKFGQEDRWHRQTISVLEGKLFPSGLVPVIRRRAKADGLAPIEVNDRRFEPFTPSAVYPPPGWLRDYQLTAAERALKFKRGILRVPMSGGKTEIFVALSIMLPVEWLYLVKKLDLVRQTAERFAKITGETAGRLDGGEWRRGTSNVTVAGFDAWWAALKRGAPCVRELGQAVEAVNVDECHTVAAETLYRGLLSLPKAYYRIGQSGTPLHREELDNLRTVGALGPVVYRLETQELIERGVIARAHVRMVACHQVIPREKQAMSWRGVHTQFIVKSGQRNRLTAEIARQAAKPCMVFVEQIKHGSAILKELQKMGVPATFVHGGASIGKRKAEVQKLVDGEYQVLVCNEIFSTGLDAPEVRATVNAAGGRAPISTLQRMGRAMRKKPDGSLDCETWDLNDSGHKWLERHSQARRETYESEGHTVHNVADLGVL